MTTAKAATTTSTTSTSETQGKPDENCDDEKLLSAPIELLSEFLSALMLRDYETAFVHCKTILQYEPENQTAMEFFPLIQQRLSEAEENSSTDEDMKSSYSDDDDSYSSSTSSDEYSTADNSLWTTTSTGTVTDTESCEKDDKTEVLDNINPEELT